MSRNNITKYDIYFHLDEFLERLAECEQMKKLRNKDFARVFNVSENVFNNWRYRKKIPLDKIVEYAARTSHSLDYLIFGQREDISIVKEPDTRYEHAIIQSEPVSNFIAEFYEVCLENSVELEVNKDMFAAACKLLLSDYSNSGEIPSRAKMKMLLELASK